MISKTLPRFWTRYQALPAAIQKAARSAFRKFSREPSHPSLQFHRVEGRSNLWSARVTGDYRAVGVMRGDTITWFWIGSHAEFDRRYPK